MQDFELKCCPCCDGQPIVLVDRIMGSMIVRIECSSCRLSTPEIMDARGFIESRRQAAAIWNRRPWDGLDAIS